MDNGMGGEEMPPMEAAPQGGDMSQGGGVPGLNPQEPMNNDSVGETFPMDDEGMPTEPMQPDDEVIDIDELTNSQEETEEKVDKANHSLAKVSKKLENVISKLTDMLDAIPIWKN